MPVYTVEAVLDGLPEWIHSRELAFGFEQTLQFSTRLFENAGEKGTDQVRRARGWLSRYRVSKSQFS